MIIDAGQEPLSIFIPPPTKLESYTDSHCVFVCLSGEYLEYYWIDLIKTFSEYLSSILKMCYFHRDILSFRELADIFHIDWYLGDISVVRTALGMVYSDYFSLL
jgi:hypothetical protein